MRRLILSLASIGMLSVTGCASSLKLENVAGTWSCDRVDGVCAEITDIDEATIGPRMDSQPIGSPQNGVFDSSGGIIPVINRVDVAMPSRTADEVARIVLAPSLDAQGRYHGSRVLFAVMKPGDWVPGSVPLYQPSSSQEARVRQRVEEDVAEKTAVAAIGEAARLSSDMAAETVTRTVTSTIVPTPTVSPRRLDNSAEQTNARLADANNAQ